MTEIEKKALALIAEIKEERGIQRGIPAPDYLSARAALIRAIEQHEAYKQDVSDAVEATLNTMLRIHGASTDRLLRKCLGYFIIPKADPLVDALYEAFPISFADTPMLPDDMSNFHEALAKRGLKIVEDTDADQEV